MAKLTDDEKRQLDALREKEEAPDDDDTTGGGGDDGHVIVLRGSRADSFLAELLGTGKSPAKGQAGGAPNGKTSRPPRKAAPGKAAPDDDDDGQGDDDDAPEQDTPPPARGHRYFS